MKKLLAITAFAVMAMTAGAQSLNKMTWFNEPASYDI